MSCKIWNCSVKECQWRCFAKARELASRTMSYPKQSNVCLIMSSQSSSNPRKEPYFNQPHQKLKLKMKYDSSSSPWIKPSIVINLDDDFNNIAEKVNNDNDDLSLIFQKL